MAERGWMRSVLGSSIKAAAPPGRLTAPQCHHLRAAFALHFPAIAPPHRSQHLRLRPASSLSAMAASRTCLVLLALVVLATFSGTAEAGYGGQPAPRPRCSRFSCIRTQPALLVELAVVLDLQFCPAQLQVFVASAVVAADQARRVCPGGRRTALNQVQVAVAVEAEVDLQVAVLDKRGKVLESLTLVLDLKEVAVVKGDVATVLVSVVIDINVKVLRFICGGKEIHVVKLSAKILIALGLLP